MVFIMMTKNEQQQFRRNFPKSTTNSPIQQVNIAISRRQRYLLPKVQVSFLENKETIHGM